MKPCPKNFKEFPPAPKNDIHPCSGCPADFFDGDGILTCIVIEKNKQANMNTIKSIHGNEIKSIRDGKVTGTSSRNHSTSGW